jgi:hypothetical protein
LVSPGADLLRETLPPLLSEIAMILVVLLLVVVFLCSSGRT